MILRNIDFGHVFCSSGSRNFFGDGYWFHSYSKHIGLDYSGSTLITKTTTLEPREGNMPLRQDSTMPVERRPNCIIIKPIEGIALNAVGLSGPGAKWLLEKGIWQKLSSPFFISFMAVSAAKEQRLAEAMLFCALLKKHLPQFRAPIGLQINISCPNAGLDPALLVDEVHELLNCFSELNIPLVIKCNLIVQWDSIKHIGLHHACDAVSCSNTIPWGKLPHRIPWKDLFGQAESPLKDLGGGGLSGKPLFPLILEWIQGVRLAGYHKPIMAGGGILSCADADQLLEVGATAIELGSISLLRPWRVQQIIRHVNSTINTRRLHQGLGLDTGVFQR